MQLLADNGIINLSDIEAELEMAQRNKYLQQHPFSIWQSSSNQLWYTYLPDEKGGRKLRYRKTKAEIQNMVVNYYRTKEEQPTVIEVFNEWVNKRLEYEEISTQTYTRYVSGANKYFTDFGKLKICNVTECDIEDFIKSTIKEFKMTHKAYSDMRTLIYGTWKFAKKKGYTTVNIKEVVQSIEFAKRQFVTKNKSDSLQIFTDKEEQRVLDYIDGYPDIINLGIKLLFKSGLRIGELCSLKRCDIYDNKLHIQRTEVFYKGKDDAHRQYVVQDSPKTDAGNRIVFLPDSGEQILKKIVAINPYGEYLFEFNGERIKSYMFQKRLYRICDELQIERKSPHKIRKTYGTKLYDSGLPESFIMQQMGHTDIAVLRKHYYYNRQENDEKSKQINNVEGL